VAAGAVAAAVVVSVALAHVKMSPWLLQKLAAEMLLFNTFYFMKKAMSYSILAFRRFLQVHL